MTAWTIKHHSLVRFINIIQNNLCIFFSWHISTFTHRINEKIKDTSTNYTDTKFLISGDLRKVLAQLCNYCWQHKSPPFCNELFCIKNGRWIDRMPICRLGVSSNFKITVAFGLKIYWYLRTLSSKFQKASIKIEVFLSLSC